MAEPKDVKVSIGAEDGDVDELGALIERVMVDGMRGAIAQLSKLITSGGQFNKTADAISKTMAKSAAAAQKAIAKEIKLVAAAQTEVARELNASSQEAYNLNVALVNIGRTVDEIKSAQSRARTSERQGAITDREIFSRDAQRRIEIVKGENSRAASAAQGLAQQQVVSARYAGKQRVLIVQEVLRTIGRLEKAFGASVAGIARTATSALSKTFSGLGSLVRRNNQTMTEGLSTSLRSRESIMRSSFSRQEQIVSRSTVRQNAAIAGLRTQTQTGVLGAANRGLNISSFIGGAAIALVARSTFTVGAEFSRGLAVLQAQLDLTGDSMAEVRRKSIALGNDISLPGVSALDAAQAIGLLSKQFASLGDEAVIAAQDASKGTLQLARAAGVGAEEAAQIVGSAVNVFGIAADQATAVADQVTAALKNAAGVSFGDFADAFKQAGAVFAQFQVPAVGATEALLQFDTALAVIARSGVVGSDAGTSLKQFFLQANRNVDETKDKLIGLTERAGETGTAFYDAAGNARPFEKTLDILRRGLVGLTDEQRNSTLQTIFGSDAIRVANALLGISTEEYSKTTEALREQGLAAKIAAAQNTGFRGALDALKSVLETLQIVFYEKINPALGAFTIAIAEAANAIFFADGAFAVVRQGLLGAAAGLAAVLAAKGAIEVFRLLGTTLGLLTSPFGFLLATFAVLGAGFAVLLKHSDDFRGAVEGLGRYLRTQGGRIFEAITTAVERVSEAFKDTKEAVTGTADRFAREAKPASRFFRDFADDIKKGLFIATTFLVDKFIPAMATVAIFIGKNFIPTVEKAIDVIGGLVDRVVGIAKGIYTYVKPGLQPAIDGFHELANAVGAAFGGDFSGLGSGAASALSGISNVVGGLVENVGKALAPVAQRVVDFFGDIFSKKSLKGYASAFLDLVEELGRILALILTSPTFVKAVAAIAAAAVVIGFRFVKGLGEGIIQNLPGLFDLLTDALLAGLDLLIDNIGTVLLVGLGAALFGPTLVSLLRPLTGLFTGAGKTAGLGFATGLKSSLSLGSAKAFFSGPNDFVALAKKNGQDAAKAQLREFNRNNNLLATGGQATISKQGFFLTSKNLDDSRVAVAKLNASLGESGARALALRNRLNENVTVLKGSVSAIRGFGDNFAHATATGATGFSRLRDAFKLTMTDLRAAAATGGTTVGRAFADGARTAAGVGLAAVGGFIAGRAEGASGGSGVFSALTAGLTGLAIGGPVVGAVAAGASLIGTAFGRAGAEAKAFKERLLAIRDAIRGDLLSALGSLSGGVLTVQTALSLKGEGGLQDEVLGLLKEDTLKRLDEADIGVNRLFDSIKKNVGNPQAILKDLGPLFEQLDRNRLGGFTASATAAGADILAVVKGLNQEIEALNRLERLNPTAPDKSGPNRRLFSDAKETYRVLAVDRDEFFNGSKVKAEQYANALAVAKSAFDSLFNIPGDTSFTEAIDEAIIGVSGVGQRIAEGIAEGTTLARAQAAEQLRGVAADFNTAIKVGLETGAITDTETARSRLQVVFDEAVKGLDPNSSTFATIATAFEEALSAITPLLTEIDATEAAAEFLRQITSVMKNLKVTVDVAANIVELRSDAIGRQVINGTAGSGGLSVPPNAVVPPRDPIINPRAGVPQSFSESDLARFSQMASSSTTSQPIEINQTFNERVDTRAAAADIAWRLT